MSPRYAVVEGSQSCHCCFDATVVDLTKPEMIGDIHFKNQFESVCECFSTEDAQRICDALNGQTLVQKLNARSQHEVDLERELAEQTSLTATAVLRAEVAERDLTKVRADNELLKIQASKHFQHCPAITQNIEQEWHTIIIGESKLEYRHISGPAPEDFTVEMLLPDIPNSVESKT